MAWAPNYVTTAELRSYATHSTSTVDDVELALAVAAASRAVDRATNRQFGVVAAAEERTYPARYDRRRCRWLVEIDDVQTTTGLEVAGVAFDADLHRLEPLNAQALGRPWTLLVLDANPGDEVTIEALWGWTAVPDPVKQATLLQGHRFAWRRASPQGVA
ncbi:MAG TPA: phage gp6-like head-tail connector protein, partial [Propionibacteriaceae bacterium]|nr:phage gp6-like head-tail connector protein [Propionibacteriaceae bacterium]